MFPPNDKEIHLDLAETLALCDGTINFDRDRDQKYDGTGTKARTRNMTGPGPKTMSGHHITKRRGPEDGGWPRRKSRTRRRPNRLRGLALT